MNIIEPKENFSFKKYLNSLSEGRIKFNPDIKIKFGRYIIKKPKLLVKPIGSKSKD